VPRRIRTHPIAETETGHLTEFLYDGGELLVCAAHGGDVEPGTAELALELARRVDGTCWACLGYDETGAYEAFHPASSAISREEYPLLDSVAEREFRTVVSLHGLGESGVLVGGAIDDAVTDSVRERLDGALAASVETVSDGEYAGTSPDNFVNWLAGDGGGLQLEVGPTTRAEGAGRLVDALAGAVRDGPL